MAFTREFIRKVAKESGVEIPKELEDALVQEHILARDAYSKSQVENALEENKPEPPPKVKDTQEYKDLKKAFDDYKEEQEGKESRAAKERAVRAYYEKKGITGKSLEIAMRGSTEEIAAIEMDGNAIKDTSTLDELVNGTFSGLITTTEIRGANTPNPPANNNKATTKEEIYKKDNRGRYILSATERQKAIAENHEQFGF